MGHTLSPKPYIAAMAVPSRHHVACRFWPVREYPWGRCETLASANSDISLLKQQVFEEGFADLKQATEERYYRCPSALLSCPQQAERNYRCPSAL